MLSRQPLPRMGGPIMVEKLKSYWRRTVVWAGVALIYALPLVAVHGAFDMFLKIDGVAGESTDDKHKEWIEVLSFSHGVSQPSLATQSSGGARATSPSQHQNLTILKTLDKSSPKLALYCCNGTHVRELSLEFCKAGGDGQKYMVYRLYDVLVTSIRPSGEASGTGTLPLEEVSFNYGKIEWTYTVMKPDGSPSGDIKASWDMSSNKGM